MNKRTLATSLCAVAIASALLLTGSVTYPDRQEETFESVTDIEQSSDSTETESITVETEVVNSEEPTTELHETPVYYESPQQYYVAPQGKAGADFMRDGVIEQGDTRFTWYSQNNLPGGGLDELNASGRFVDEDGIVRDGEGYVAVASRDYAKGEVIDTPFGQGKVYDWCEIPGTVDIYTNF